MIIWVISLEMEIIKNQKKKMQDLIEMKKAFNRSIGIIDIAEEIISELNDYSIEIT